jgi:hypothetical protein
MVGNVLTTLWGLIAFAGFATTLLVPRTDEYLTQFKASILETDRENAARWSGALRTVPVVVLAVVLAVSLGAARDAGWSTPLTTMDFWLLATAAATQFGFVFAVRYLVPSVPKTIPVVQPRTDVAWPGIHSGSPRPTISR